MSAPRPQNPDYPDKRYAGVSVVEFIHSNPQSWCHECQRVHGLTKAQILALMEMVADGRMY